MIEIEIINYESIDHAKISIDKFTSLIGRNHIGKSAILRAINAALTNKDGTEFIKWGKNFCEVKINIKDKNFSLLWHKEKNNNYYEINGKTYKKIGRSEVPPEIQEAGFKLIQVGTTKIDLNYAVQFSPLFLIDKIDSTTTDLLTSVLELDRLYKAISLCNKEQKNNSSFLKIREKDLNLTKEDIKRYENVPLLNKLVENLKDKKKKIDSIEEEISKLKVHYDNLKLLSNSISKLSSISKIKTPDYLFLRDIIKDIVDLKTWNVQINNLSVEIKKLEPSLNLKIDTKKIQDLKKEKEDYLKLRDYLNKIKNLSYEIKRLENIKNIEIPSINIDKDELLKLKDILTKMISIKKEQQEIEKNLNNIKEQEKVLLEELKQFKYCPLCGQKLS